MRKIKQKGKHCDIKKTYLFHKNVRGKGLPVVSPLLQEKTLQFKKKVEGGDSEFTANEGWLDLLKKRFGIRYITISSKALSENCHANSRIQRTAFRTA